MGFKNLLKSIECQNIATSFGIRYYGRGPLTAENFVSYVRYEFMAREMINSTLNYAPMLKAMYTNITSSKKYHRVKLMWVALDNCALIDISLMYYVHTNYIH